MRPNRRAAQSTTSIRTIAIVVAVCAAVITSLVVARGGDDEASAGPAAAGVAQHGSGHAASGGAYTDTGTQTAPSGPQPVTDVDRTFLVKVRQAGLWEIPAGRLAQTHASSESVKRAGLHLIDGHSKLDQLVREDAKILGVALPNAATDEQQGFVKQLENAQGAEFDRIFANLLRASHGKIFATIGEVRAATQNDLIRRHARQANQTVLDHMEVLEDTGLVDNATLREVEAAVAPK
jgi:predicted outer membrane protein